MIRYAVMMKDGDRPAIYLAQSYNWDLVDCLPPPSSGEFPEDFLFFSRRATIERFLSWMGADFLSWDHLGSLPDCIQVGNQFIFPSWPYPVLYSKPGGFVWLKLIEVERSKVGMVW